MLDMMSNEWIDKIESETAKPKVNPDGFRRVIRALRTQESSKYLKWPSGDTRRIILLLLAMSPLRAQQLSRIINGERSFQKVSDGVIYRHLRELEDAGLVEKIEKDPEEASTKIYLSDWDEEVVEERGRPWRVSRSAVAKLAFYKTRKKG